MLKRNSHRLIRQFALVPGFLAILGLMACESANEFGNDLLTPETVSPVDFRGAVVADEPLAALTGREVLMANGNAIDAVVAASFALTATLPSRTGLAGSGTCLVHSAYHDRNAVMDMIATPPANPKNGDRPAAVSTMARGLYALHARHGSLPWAEVVAPAEKMARFGVPVSRALAADLETVGAPLLADSGARRIFGGSGGRSVKREGDRMINLPLAELLSEIRARGAKGFHNRAYLKRFVEGARRAGGALDAASIIAAKPAWREPLRVNTSKFLGSVFFTPPPTAGVAAAQIWGMLTFDDINELASLGEDELPGQAAHRLAESAALAYSDRTRRESGDGRATVDARSLVAVEHLAELLKAYNPDRHVPTANLNPKPKTDFVHPAGTVVAALARDGSAAVCLYTMNKLFGTGRIAGDTGLLLPAMPGPGGRGPGGLAGMISLSKKGSIYSVAGAAGGVAAPTALAQTVVFPLVNVSTLAQSQKRARIHRGGGPDIVFHERGLAEDVLKTLKRKGHETRVVDALGRVNAIVCSEGMPGASELCAAEADPRGFGLAASANW